MIFFTLLLDESYGIEITQNFPFASYCKDDGYDANGKVEEDGAAFFLKGKVIRSRYDALASSGLIRNFPRCSSIRYNFSCLKAFCGPFPISCCSSPQANIIRGRYNIYSSYIEYFA